MVQKGKTLSSSDHTTKSRPALTPESRENQLVSLAMDLAEKQLRDGTASSQVISHYIKAGSVSGRLEREMLEMQKELTLEKTKAIQSGQRIEELYKNAMDAMRNYSGQGGGDDY